MKTKRIILLALALAVFAGTLAGGLSAALGKPDLYYPGDKDSYAFLEDWFRLVWAPRALLEGDCSAGKGDCVALRTSERTSYADGGEVFGSSYEISLAEKFAGQKASVILFSKQVTSESRFGTLFYEKGGKIRTERLYGRDGKDFARKLSWKVKGGAVRMAALIIAAVLSGALALFLAAPLIVKRKAAEPGPASEPLSAAARLSPGRRRFSLAAAGFNLAVMLAWSTAWLLYPLWDPYSSLSPLVPFGAGLPFLLLALAALGNLTKFKRFRRWLNIVSIVLACITAAYLVFGLAMMLLRQ